MTTSVAFINDYIQVAYKNIMKKLISILIILASFTSIANAKENKNIIMEKQQNQLVGDTFVDIKTSLGNIRIRLYGETPKHRDNFIKLVNEGFYNDVLFHRVINQFMIQTGDPESKDAAAGKMLGSGGPGYDIDAEIVYPQYFHKRGALAAARQGDEVNPKRRSSGSQFYIVTGKVYNTGQLGQMEKQLQYQQMQSIFNNLVSQHRDSIMNMRRNRDQVGLQALQEELAKKTEAEAAKNPIKFTPEQIEAYSSVGGTPHLDGTYTVFGEVIDGMDVVAKIETSATGAQDRPKEDIKIISMSIVK